MKHNTCTTCGAGENRAGTLINGECRNCHETRRTGMFVVFNNLPRTQSELVKTAQILSPRPETCTHDDVVQRIRAVLSEMSGEELAKEFSRHFSDDIVYNGDSLFTVTMKGLAAQG